MIVMYLTAPVSAITSIWRSYSLGFIDPCFYYYRCTYIGRSVKLEKIGLSRIKADELLREMSIVNKNKQGINGVELKPSEYNYIAEKLIKPLLDKLGYSETDYVQ